ncbi:3',5'-cyclic-nucleotide phosphodiesterase PDE2 [Aspergillus clavatus NRRL 1]|uniref:Phosphodiesterase n=1 Tax=Aspergillus clavatus (strain ATCC 1007 / CBS 513.65 / DSM 816 / NCTC 3887 / NRRL 1 / QM 1276 / 107) TaxID=344612 RepID=A1CRE2_ASPCL|nr:high affinity cAMP phosphodiesterase, putative [Aspergillus clavatus NRRL 1]EAW08213.1 high affinity cAMP phosphodiesterase, putative [Aspergillus clavatus NRRL 1]
MGIPNPAETMDRVECCAVYIDDRVQSERWVYRDSPVSSAGDDEPESLGSDVALLLEVCNRIYLCHVGTSLATKLAELSDSTNSRCTPIFAFFDIELGRNEDSVQYDRRKASRSSWPDVAPPSPSSLRRGFTFSSQSDTSYGLQLLSGVSADIQVSDIPNLVIPIAVLRHSHGGPTSAPTQQTATTPLFDPLQISKCLDAGAADVLTTPLDRARVQGLVVHAYRAQKSARKEQSRFLARKKSRKQSWVGVHDQQPYAYLREAMVSKLMKGICNPEEVIEEFQDRDLDVSAERQKAVRKRLGNWNFTAHAFSEDELVYGACQMLQHAFTLPNLDRWQLTACELRTFLLACRASYNSFVLYHNFRHAIDVLQSVFCFLVHIGALPPYGDISPSPGSQSPIASLLTPFDTLTLLISAIGHDVGHPGVNNFFLVKLNAPLAQLYNDNSVLEAFHCAAFSQILRRHWPAAFKDRQLRKLLISSILATDMGVHQKFMERLGSLQEKFYANNKSVDGWKPQDIEIYKTLVCGLLIKCADISNVARPWDVAEKWTKILQEEFANQGEMEREVGMETALFGGPPELGNIYKLATGQIGFMSIFALPLFEGVSDILPQLRFTVEHIRTNQSRWHYLADNERKKQALTNPRYVEGVLSPRSHSPAASFRGLRPPLADSSAKSALFPDDVAAKKRAATDDYFGTLDPDIDSGSPSDYNENTISPVVSPDTPGPSMDITGSPLPSAVASRKSSGAVPDLTMISIAGTSPETNGGQADHHSNSESRRSSRDAVIAAVLFADTAVHDAAAPELNTKQVDGHGVADGQAERPSSSRQGLPHRRHHANTNSSGRGSGAPNSQRNSCTRTHSVSTYSNTMTPISPVTNATSFITADSGDEKRASREDMAGEQDKSEARPGSSKQHANADKPHESYRHFSDSNTSHSHLGDGSKSPVTASIVGNGSNSPTHSITTTPSIRNEGHPHWEDSMGGEQPPRRLPKRRSRLRLAFWKRKTHHSHQHELSGET